MSQSLAFFCSKLNHQPDNKLAQSYLKLQSCVFRLFIQLIKGSCFNFKYPNIELLLLSPPLWSQSWFWFQPTRRYIYIYSLRMVASKGQPIAVVALKTRFLILQARECKQAIQLTYWLTSVLIHSLWSHLLC